MALYDYQCPRCAHRFESIAKMSEETKPCPECGAEAKRDEIPQIRRLNGEHANASSVRFHFNWIS